MNVALSGYVPQRDVDFTGYVDSASDAFALFRAAHGDEAVVTRINDQDVAGQCHVCKEPVSEPSQYYLDEASGFYTCGDCLRLGIATDITLDT